MKIKVNPFPAIYYSVICEKHECRVLVETRLELHPRKEGSSHGSITTSKCEVGGNPLRGNCTDSWVMIINAPGDVTVAN